MDKQVEYNRKWREKKRKNKTITCQVCGQTISLEKHRKNKVVCSDECRRKRNAEISKKWREDHTILKKCECCGREFESASRSTKYCSDECRKLKKKPNEDIASISVKAKAMGMSYGQYQAMQYLTQMRYTKE